MALDVGDVRIGVALSDETETLASGLVTLKSVGPRKDVQALAAPTPRFGPEYSIVIAGSAF